VIRVLLADDAEAMRIVIRAALETDGRFEVVGDAADGAQALELLESVMPDALVLDMAMPNVDGLEVLKQMRLRGLSSKVLAFSGFNGAVEDQARALGADDYLRKGGSIEELAPRLAALCS
jgi:CheY-like chemotaxis protein